jgi:hypothetical protein
MIGTLWAVNRYFAERTDAPQFRVDCDISMIHGDSRNEPGLLIFRLDLVNTGKTQIGKYKYYIEIDVAKRNKTGVELQPLYRWPKEGSREGGPIEPGSWAAVNDAVACSSSVKAVRVFLAVALEQDQWTWHKTFDVSRGEE